MQINIKIFLTLIFCGLFIGCEAAPKKANVDVEAQHSNFNSLLSEYKCDEGPYNSPTIKTYMHGEFTTYKSVVEVLCNGMPHSEHYVIAASYKSNGNQRLRYRDLVERPSLEEAVSLASAYAGLNNSDCVGAIYDKRDVYFSIGEDGDKIITVNAAYPAMECTIEYNIDRPEKSEFPLF